MHLIVFLSPSGIHEGSWRLPTVDPTAHLRLTTYLEQAKTAERGLFDAVFFADFPNFVDWNGRLEAANQPGERLDPIVLLSAMAVVTERVGLIATGSTTFDEPYSLARRFGSLDVISKGRAGWNVVTSFSDAAAKNYSSVNLPSHEDRYRRGREFLEVVLGLWAEWGENAIVAEKVSGVYADLTKINPVNYRGNIFSVTGPLNVPPSPQGKPLIVQAGSSRDGMRLAADYADVVFTVQSAVEGARVFYSSLKEQVRSSGRDPKKVLVLPGVTPVVGSTDDEARRRGRELDDLLVLDESLEVLSLQTGLSIDQLDLDAPLPSNIRDPEEYSGSRGVYQEIVSIARAGNLTIRQLLTRLGANRVHKQIVGTPEHVADMLEDWFATDAADGFNVIPAVLPSGLEDFVEHVVPILQQRGLFRRDYEGTTLREILGLSVG